jgi:hypothetical protein
MAYYNDGLKIPTRLWEAAAMHKKIMVSCRAGGCEHRAIFDPHCLWWLFRKNGWDDSFYAAQRRFYCRKCSAADGRRVKQAYLQCLSVDASVTNPLPFPNEREWKTFLSRHKG